MGISVNGPVPTGVSFVAVAGSLIDSQMCFGAILSEPRSHRAIVYGSFIVTTNVVASGASTEATKLSSDWRPPPSPGRSLLSIMYWKVKATSSAENASPSDHLTPDRIL